MTVYVFIGPTLRPSELQGWDVVCLPPAAQGDVHRAARQRPRAIGIVDGYFSGAPSVWHKEILWALSEGIPVLGSASMGALRAAELHRFGMRGIGRIFEWYRDGVIEDDDEVAVVHGPAELAYLPVSEPMVNIRSTLARAEAEGVLSADGRLKLETFAKSLFFPQRSWPALLEGTTGVAVDELAQFGAWIPDGRIDQKREDALEMLAALKATASETERFRPDFRFEWTTFWDDLIAQPSPHTLPDAASDPSQQQADVLDELRLEGVEAYHRLKRAALVRVLADAETRRLGLPVVPDAVRAELSRIRKAHGLYRRADLDGWLLRNGFGAADLERLAESEARLAAITDVWRHSLDGLLLDELRVRGDYEKLLDRARTKRSVLDAAGPGRGSMTAYGPEVARARVWLFAYRWRGEMPDNVEEVARELGFRDMTEFNRVVVREWLFQGDGALTGTTKPLVE